MIVTESKMVIVDDSETFSKGSILRAPKEVVPSKEIAPTSLELEPKRCLNANAQLLHVTCPRSIRVVSDHCKRKYYTCADRLSPQHAAKQLIKLGHGRVLLTQVRMTVRHRLC